MAITISDITGLLKTKYAGAIADSVVKKTMLLNQVEASNDDVISGSRTIRHPVRLTRNMGVGFRSNSTQSMPQAGGSKVVQAESVVKSLYAYLEFNGDALRATENNEGAFAKLLQSELQETRDSLRLEINRALYGWGRGDLGTITAAAGAPNNTITIGNAPNIEWFDENMYIDIYDSTGATLRGTFQITAIDKATNTLTLDADPVAAGVVANDITVVNGNLNNEPYGLLAFADDGTYVANLHGISNTTYSRWNGYVNDISGNALTELILQEFFTYLEPRADENDILVITTPAIRNKIARIIKSTMLQPQTLDLKGGFKALSYNGIPIYADFYAPAGYLFGFGKKHLKLHQIKPAPKKVFSAIDFVDYDNSVLHGVRNSDVYWVKAVADFQFTTDKRNAFARIENIDPTL